MTIKVNASSASCQGGNGLCEVVPGVCLFAVNEYLWLVKLPFDKHLNVAIGPYFQVVVPLSGSGLPQLQLLSLSQVIHFCPGFELDRQFVPVRIRQLEQGLGRLGPVRMEPLQHGHGNGYE
jgi:hypothetical protein